LLLEYPRSQWWTDRIARRTIIREYALFTEEGKILICICSGKGKITYPSKTSATKASRELAKIRDGVGYDKYQCKNDPNYYHLSDPIGYKRRKRHLEESA
jgi:hypothetical protein